MTYLKFTFPCHRSEIWKNCTADRHSLSDRRRSENSFVPGIFLQITCIPVTISVTVFQAGCYGRIILKPLKEKYIAKDDRITGINMRSKRVSWKKQVMDVTLEKGNLESVMEDFSFNRFFLSLYGNRPSCFHCHYTSYKRPGDFTLGDFWNVENAGVTFDVEGGVNLGGTRKHSRRSKAV